MLDWPLQKGHCEVKLLNQIGDNDHHIERGVYQEKGHDKVISGSKVTCGERSNPFMWGSNQFISHDHLLKRTPTCQYIKDDIIFFQVDYRLP